MREVEPSKPEKDDKAREQAEIFAKQLHSESDSQPYKPTNPTVPITVVLSRNTVPGYELVSENVFLCPLWERATEKFEKIYISEEYKLNDTTLGRFVFADRNNKKVVMTVAEQPAYSKKIWPEDNELAYLAKRQSPGNFYCHYEFSSIRNRLRTR